MLGEAESAPSTPEISEDLEEMDSPKMGTFEAWEQNNIDFLGVDSFDNILAYLLQQIAQTDLC